MKHIGQVKRMSKKTLNIFKWASKDNPNFFLALNAYCSIGFGIYKDDVFDLEVCKQEEPEPHSKHFPVRFYPAECTGLPEEVKEVLSRPDFVCKVIGKFFNECVKTNVHASWSSYKEIVWTVLIPFDIQKFNADEDLTFRGFQKAIEQFIFGIKDYLIQSSFTLTEDPSKVR